MSKTRMGKRVASLLLSLVMMLSLLPTTVYAEGADTGATNDAVVEETIAPVNAEGVDAVAQEAESSEDEVSGVESNELVNFVTVNEDATKYETLEEAVAAAEPVNGVITYTISGKVNVNSEGWVQVAKAGLTGLTKVAFVGAGTGAEICIVENAGLLADEQYDINVSFQNLTLSKKAPGWVGDMGHAANYFTTWLRNSGAAENTVTYTDCTFPNGVCNNQYGKTVFENCTFSNETPGLYNLWNYGGNTEVKNSAFTGTRGIKTYNEGTLEVAPTVKVENTSFTGLSEKAAIVASKATDITLTDVSATDCNKGLFQKDIEGSTDAEKVTIAANGSGIGGTFSVTATKDVEVAKDEFNISAGTFKGEVSSDYLADGLTIEKDGNGNYGVTEAATTIDLATFIKNVENAGYNYDGKGVTVKWSPVSGCYDTRDGHPCTVNNVQATGNTPLKENSGLAQFSLFKDASNVTIKNVKFVYEAADFTICANSGWSGSYTAAQVKTAQLYLQNSGNTTIEGCSFDNVVFTSFDNTGSTAIANCQFKNIYNAYAIKDLGGSSVSVTGSTFESCGGGVMLNSNGSRNASDTVTITGNTFTNVDVTGTAADKKVGTRALIQIASTGDYSDTTFDFGSGETANKAKNCGPVLRQLNESVVDSGKIGEIKNDVKDLVTADGASGMSTGDSKMYKAVAKIGDKEYETLADAIAAAKTGETVTLLADTIEDVTINKNITLDLGGKTLTNTNTGKATISVSNGATATVKNGSVKGGTSYYNIEVTKDSNANLTLEGVTATAGNTGSSMIDNWGTLTIESGDYSGGMNTVKSEEGSTLTINGGKFTCDFGKKWSYTAVILVYGTTTITGGEFIQKTTNTSSYAAVVMTGKEVGYEATTKVTGGKFTNEKLSGIFHAYTPATSANFEVSGGTFNKSISEGFCADGFIPVKNADGNYGVKEGKFVAEVGSTGYETFDEAIAAANASTKTKTVHLRENITVDHQLVINNAKGKTITLNLEGFTLTSTYAISASNKNGSYALVNNTPLTIKNGTFAAGEARAIGALATLTLDGATVSQMLTGGHACVAFCKDGATYTIKKNSTIDGAYAVCNFANNATITISDSKLIGRGNTLYHNGSNYGLKLTVTNTTIEGNGNGCGVYISGSTSAQSNAANQNGAGGYQQATFTNCTISGTNGVEVKYTDLTLKNCTVTATVKTPSYEQDNNGPAGSGFAVVATDNATNGVTPVPTGTITITGDGKYTGPVGLGSLESVKTDYKDFKDETIKVSGGTFTTAVPEDYCAEGYIPKDNGNGTYGVKKGVYVARIKEVKYETLQAAIDAAGDNSTVALMENVVLTEAAVFPAGKKVNLNLMGYDITATGTALLINGKADIQDTEHTGTIESTGNVAVAVGDNASLTVYSGTLKGREGAVITGTSTGATIEIRGSKATLIATDNAVIAGNGSQRDGKPNTIKVMKGTLEGGIESEGYIACGIYAPWNDNVTVSGGTFNITNGAGIVARAGTVKVTGGTFNCTGDGTGWVGDNKNQIPCAALVFDKAANYPALTDASQILVSGGTFSTDPAANGATLDAGYVAALNADGVYKVAKLNPAAEINGVKYDTLQAAINAAQATEGGATITLLKNINTESYYTVNGDNPVTIDLAGHNITGSGISGLFYVTAKGDLTIKGEGTVTAVEDNGAAMVVWVRSSLAKVTLEGGTYTQQITNANDPQFDLIYVEYGTVYVKGGTYKGATPDWTLNCKDEHYLSKEANIEVTGGTFAGYDPRNNKAEGAGTSFVAEGVGVDVDASGNFTAKAGMVAQIIAANGSSVKAYATLADAIAAAQNGQTVKLLADTRENVTISTRNLTLDLNGHTLNGGTGTATAALYNLGTIIIKDSSTAKTGTIMREDKGTEGETSYYVIRNLGTMTIESGTVSNNSGYRKTNPYGSMDGSSLICNGDGDERSTLTINGGTFTQKNFIAIKNGALGVLHVSGGKIDSDHSAIQNWFEADITGGEITGQLWTDAYIAGESVGETRIGGDANFTGEIVMDIYGSVAPTLAITGGNLNVTNWRITTTAANAGAKPAVSGGTFKAAVPAKYCAPGYVPTDADADGFFTVEEGKFTVQVTSRTVSSNTPVANVSGGGSNVTYAGGTTVTAASLSGYKFVGWFVNEYTGTPYSTDLTCGVKPTDDCTMIAVYKPVEGGIFELTVNASKFTVNDGAVQTSYLLEKIDVGASVTVKFKGTEKFLYWVNESKKVVSTNPEYTFYMGSATTLNAVYAEKQENQAMVVFVSLSGQVISSKSYTDKQPITFPEPPIKMGATFEKWSMTEAQIRAAMATTETGIIIVEPVYVSNETEATVTITYPDQTTDTKTGTVGKVITLTAKSIEGKEFKCWKYDGMTLGYTETLKVAPRGTMNLEAVYVTAGEPVTRTPVIELTEISASKLDEKYVVSFTATRSVPENYTVIGQGVLASTNSRYAEEDALEAMKLDSKGNPPAGVFKYADEGTDSIGVTVANGKTSYADRVVYGRAYMILKNEDTGATEYYYGSEILSNSYNGLTSNGGN